MEKDTIGMYKSGDEWSLPIIRSTIFVSIFNGMPDALIISSTDGAIKQVNAAAEQLFKYTREQLLNMHVEDLVPVDLREKHIKHREHFIKDPQSRYMGARQLSLSAIDGNGKEVYIESALFSHASKHGVLIVNIIRETTKRRDQFLALSEKAFYDCLTKSANRYYLHEILSGSLARAKRKETLIALLYIDVDHFKIINDTYGHKVGDEVLIGVSDKLNSLKREGDFVARLGGDEFSMVLFQLNSKDDLQAITERIFAIFKKALIINNIEICVSISIGVAYNVDVDNDEALLFETADKNMYKSKHKGGGVASSE